MSGDHVCDWLAGLKRFASADTKAQEFRPNKGVAPQIILSCSATKKNSSLGSSSLLRKDTHFLRTPSARAKMCSIAIYISYLFNTRPEMNTSLSEYNASDAFHMRYCGFGMHCAMRKHDKTRTLRICSESGLPIIPLDRQVHWTWLMKIGICCLGWRMIY